MDGRRPQSRTEGEKDESNCNRSRKRPSGHHRGCLHALADFNVNVLDISQTVMQGYFTMMMATEVSACNVPLGELVTRMDEIGKEMGLSIRVQREDIFEAMHRI